MLRLQEFVDPNFGSERYLELDPSWIVEAEDTILKVFPLRKYPATIITLRNGRQHRVHGHCSEQIKAAQAQVATQGS